MSSTVLQRDLYTDYLTSCGKVSRNVLNVPSFYKLLRLVHLHSVLCTMQCMFHRDALIKCSEHCFIKNDTVVT